MSTETTGRPRTVVHTDGACVGNPGPGGWAAVVRENGENGAATKRTLVGGRPATTNNQMEMTAAIEALKALPEGPIEIVSDSQILIKGMNEWLPGWKARGWKNASKEPVKNRDLWEELDALRSGREVVWSWVRGHNGNPENEEADRLAEAEAERWAAGAAA